MLYICVLETNALDVCAGDYMLYICLLETNALYMFARD